MTEFKTHFKPLRTIFLAVCFLICSILLVFLLFLMVISNSGNFDLLEFVLLFIFILFCLYLIVKTSIKICVRYTIREAEIERHSFITFKKKIIPKSEIKGFSKSWAMARAKSYDLTIIYLKNGDKIIFHELDFHNYYEIKPNLTKLGYYYFGHEGEEFKGFFTRIYKFDNEK
jgi:hypothetical protein